VTTTPEIMHTVAGYLAQENQRLSRQVAINVEVYAVTLKQGLDFNVAFNIALHRLTDFGGNIESGFNGAPAVTTIHNPLENGPLFPGNSTLSLAIINPHGPGDAALTNVFTALSGIGDTVRVARFPLITLNNRPVSRRIGTDTAYVASVVSNPSSTTG